MRENYKAQGTIVRSKEKLIIDEEQPTKFFYQQEQQKQAKKTTEIMTITIKNKLQNLKWMPKILPKPLSKRKYQYRFANATT